MRIAQSFFSLFLPSFACMSWQVVLNISRLRQPLFFKNYNNIKCALRYFHFTTRKPIASKYIIDMAAPFAADQFRLAVAEAVASVSSYSKEQLVDVLEEPRDAKNGDIALPIPSLKKFGKVEGNPAELAKSIAAKFQPTHLVLSASAIGPFLNFRINKEELVKRVLGDVLAAEEKYGFSNEGEGKSVVVEFSSPNIAKPFHAGHLRSTIIGNFISNIYEGMAYKVTRINYLGDWGKQYGLLAVGFEKFGSEEKLVQDPIQHLFEVYVQVNKAADADPTIHDVARDYFKRMEDGDEQALALWKRFRDLSIVKYKEIYARLNIRFDVYSGESLYGERMAQEVAVLQEKNLLTEDNGAQLVDLSTANLGKVIVRKSNGTTLYITRDIAACHERFETYKFDKMIYVVASQQELHFKQLFSVLDKMGYSFQERCQHVSFGMVKGMSTRKGDVVFLEDILVEAKDTMNTVMMKTPEKYALIENPDEVADLVGLSAVVIQDMSARRIKDYEFKWERITSFEGDTGPYLQYTHARIASIERKVGSVNKQANVSLLTEPTALAIIELLSKYPSMVRLSMRDLEPNTLVGYAFSLAHTISTALEDLRVIGQEQSLSEARLLLYYCARVTLGNILRLVGLKPLERM